MPEYLDHKWYLSFCWYQHHFQLTPKTHQFQIFLTPKYTKFKIFTPKHTLFYERLNILTPVVPVVPGTNLRYGPDRPKTTWIYLPKSTILFSDPNSSRPHLVANTNTARNKLAFILIIAHPPSGSKIPIQFDISLWVCGFTTHSVL